VEFLVPCSDCPIFRNNNIRMVRSYMIDVTQTVESRCCMQKERSSVSVTQENIVRVECGFPRLILSAIEICF
jgi:hypothetical protein